MSTRQSGRRRFVCVTVYDEIEALRTAASRYSKWTGVYREGEFDAAYGVTHSFRNVPDEEGRIKAHRRPTAAHIRLCRGYLSAAIVTHEVCHAATAIYEQDCLDEQGSVHDSVNAEETLCYLVGDLSARIVNRLYFYGYYGEV